MSCSELRESFLVRGPGGQYPQWDAEWRRSLVDNLEILVGQLWQVGIDDIFIDGSFVEDKDHPNDQSEIPHISTLSILQYEPMPPDQYVV